MAITNTKVSKSEAREALLRFGYLLESGLEVVSNNRGYYFDANSVYEYTITMKPRELDLYALGAKRVWKEYNFDFSCLLTAGQHSR